MVGADSCGDESGGDRVDDFATGAGAGVAAGIDFDGDGIVGIDAEFFPGFGGVRFSGEGGEEGGDGIFYCFWVGIEIGEKGGVFSFLNGLNPRKFVPTRRNCTIAPATSTRSLARLTFSIVSAEKPMLFRSPPLPPTHKPFPASCSNPPFPAS